MHHRLSCLAILLNLVWLVSPAFASRIATSQISYVGAFKLPAGIGNYGGLGATWNPDGNGGAGTLVVQGDTFTDTAAEVTPPTPQPLAQITTYANLPTATQVRAETSLTGGLYPGGGQNQMSSLGYYKSGSHPTKLCWSFFNYYAVGGDDYDDNYLGCSNPLGQTPSPGGAWNAAPLGSTRVGGHVFQIPTSVATRWGSATRDLCFGITRDSGAFGGSAGPVLICGNPWSTGDTFVAGSTMSGPSSPIGNAKQLIAYEDTGTACPENGTNCQLTGYIGADIWTGAGYWANGSSEAVVFAGKKCVSTQSYYCPSQGWWCGPNPGGSNCVSDPQEPRLLFYDVDEIAQVGGGTLAYNAIQPYTYLSLPNPFGIDSAPVYDQYGHMAYDAANQRIYLVQRYVGPGNAEPVVHVLSLSAPSGGDTTAPAAPTNLRVVSP